MVRPIVTALFGLALCLAAATFDSPSLYVPGVAFVVLPVAAVAWVELAARGATIARRAGPHTVVEEQPYPVRVEMETGVVPPPGGELFEPLLGWPVPIAGRWSRRLRINVRFSRRGKRVLAPARLSVRDPLRLYARELSGAGGEEVLVLPRVEPVTAPGGDGAGAGDRGGQGAEPGLVGRRIDAATAELEIDGLRPYREGAPASRIHWLSVARPGEMLERRLVAELDSAPLIVLDASAPASEEALDKAVRAAASICVWLARNGGGGRRRVCGASHPLRRRHLGSAPDPARHLRRPRPLRRRPLGDACHGRARWQNAARRPRGGRGGRGPPPPPPIAAAAGRPARAGRGRCGRGPRAWPDGCRPA